MLLYSILAIFGAFLLTAFLYVHKRKKRALPYLLFVLRFFSISAILLLLINPVFNTKEFYIQKPKLVVAVDNSASIKELKREEVVKKILTKITTTELLQEKFDIDYLSFGNEVQILDSLTFKATQTNQAKLLKQVNSLYQKKKIPIVLITDGNQTTGENYNYFSSKNPIYPIVVGDTTRYKDVEITQLNTNPYAFLDNNFPVEIFVNYKGSTSVKTQLILYENKQPVYTKKLRFSPAHTSENLSILLPANTVGNHYYSAVVKGLENEKNTRNNRKDFSVEVVDQQTKVLLLSSFYHPDLAAIKKSIESNKQRKVELEIITNDPIKLSDYHVVILYQPTEKFAKVYKNLQEEKLSAILITGTQTDWQFLNRIQKDFSKNRSLHQKESFQAIYNPDFSTFVLEDSGFEHLPPLKDVFGNIHFNRPYQSLLFQKINTIATKNPLLAVYEGASTKNVVLFGEDIWRWRLQSKIAHKSFKPFNDFWNTLVQYTATKSKTKQLHITYEKLRYSNQEQMIKAFYVDQNYQVDTQVSIALSLKDENQKTTKIPFVLKESGYQVVLPNLNAGQYSFQVEVIGKQLNSFGSFKILNYSVEQQFSTANKDKLQQLALQSGGSLSYADDSDSVIAKLLDDTKYKSVQKSKKTTSSLIDWRWLLGFIILSLSSEWFVRKYRGLV